MYLHLAQVGPRIAVKMLKLPPSVYRRPQALLERIIR